MLELLLVALLGGIVAASLVSQSTCRPRERYRLVEHYKPRGSGTSWAKHVPVEQRRIWMGTASDGWWSYG